MQKGKMDVVEKLAWLKEDIAQAIIKQTFAPELFTYYKEFSFDTLRYENYRRGRTAINLGSVFSIARLLEIIEVVMTLAKKGECITKRNLYYKLIHYYKCYKQVDLDIEILTLNLNVSREELMIMSSSRCLLIGNVVLELDGNEIVCTEKVITSINSFRKVGKIETKCKNILIIEKQSALHQLSQGFFNTESDWAHETILISSKGYPDTTSREIVESLSKIVENIYYLGDDDIFGVDILLCYSIGFNTLTTILNRIKWIDLTQIIDASQLEAEYQCLSVEDKKKYMDMVNRNYINNIEIFLPKDQQENDFKAKLISWKHRLRNMKEINKKIELQSLFKYLPNDWMELMLKEQAYI